MIQVDEKFLKQKAEHYWGVAKKESDIFSSNQDAAIFSALRDIKTATQMVAIVNQMTTGSYRAGFIAAVILVHMDNKLDIRKPIRDLMVEAAKQFGIEL